MIFPCGSPVLLNTGGLAFQHLCITFPLCGVHARVSACAHGGMCAMRDLFGQCILRSGSECPSSHCLGACMCLCIAFQCYFVLIDLSAKHLLALALLLFRSMLFSCLPLSRWTRAFNSTFLWCTDSFTCGRLGTTAFGQVAYVLSYLIMSGHIEFTNSGHAACVSELPRWVCAAGLGWRLHDIIVFRHCLSF